MLSLLSKLMKNFVNEVKFLIKFFYVEYKLFVLRYYLPTKLKNLIRIFRDKVFLLYSFWVILTPSQEHIQGLYKFFLYFCALLSETLNQLLFV